MSYTPLIDWIDYKLKLWGVQRRWNARQNSYPQSPAGRLDEPIGHGQQPDPPEVFTGQAIEAAIAIGRALAYDTHPKDKLTAIQWLTLADHYDGGTRPLKRKLADHGVSRQVWYQRLAGAHRRLEQHWPESIKAENGVVVERIYDLRAH